MKKILVAIAMVTASMLSLAQTTYDSKTLVDTNNTSTSTSTVNTNNTNTNTSTSTSASTVTSTSSNTNTNYNVNSGTQTINNNNVNSGTMTYNNNNVNTGDMTYRNINTTTSDNKNTNVNINSGTMTYNNNNVSTSTNNNINTSTSDNKNTNYNYGTMTNNNNNVNTSTSTSTNSNNNVNQNVQTGDMTNRNINDTNITQKVIQPPPTAIAPAMMSGGNNDLCTTGTSGSVQTQIFGVSSGGTVRDMNCERLKLSKTLYDMGMKVAAVATMCQDRRVFDSMMAAGTPCPYEGMIGAQAKLMWESNPDKIPKLDTPKEDDTYKKVGIGSLLGIAVFKLFGF